MTDNTSNLPVTPMPRTKAALLAQRLNKSARDFNDMVEQVLLENIDDQELGDYLEAADNDKAVTGRCDYDDVMAAHRIKELAYGMEIIPVAEEKIATIKRALGVALRRYGLTRKQRVQKSMHDAERAAAAAGVAE